MPPSLVSDPDLVTGEWLTEVLHHDGAIGAGTRVTAVDRTSIGTGQVGANVRCVLTYEGPPGPPSVVCKFSSRDPQSAAAGIRTLTYETEVAFYRDLAGSVDISRPHCFFADVEPGTADVVLVLEDVSPARQGDQVAGCTVEQATLAVDEAAKLHGPRWGDAALEEPAWLKRSGSDEVLALLPSLWGPFGERYGARLAPVTVEEGERLFADPERLWAHEPPVLTVVHNDYRLDNMLFAPEAGERPLVVVDWQTVRLGLGPHDVAYFLGSAFDADLRRSCEERLVGRYHDRLVGYDVSGYSLEQCWDDYRRSSYASLVMAVLASMLVGRTERGDEMFLAMANRSAQMVADLDASSLLG